MADAVNSPYLKNGKLLLNCTEGLSNGNKIFLETSFFFDARDSKDAFAHKWSWHIS